MSDATDPGRAPTGDAPARARSAKWRLAVVPVLSVAALGAVLIVAEVARPPGTTSLYGVSLGMRVDEVMSTFEPRAYGSWDVGAGADTAVSWRRRGTTSDAEPVRARFEFFQSRLAAVRATYAPTVSVSAIRERIGLAVVEQRGGAYTWDLPGSFAILMREADGNRSLFLLDATSPRYEGEIEVLRRVDALGR